MLLWMRQRLPALCLLQLVGLRLLRVRTVGTGLPDTWARHTDSCAPRVPRYRRHRDGRAARPL